MWNIEVYLRKPRPVTAGCRRRKALKHYSRTFGKFVDLLQMTGPDVSAELEERRAEVEKLEIRLDAHRQAICYYSLAYLQREILGEVEHADKMIEDHSAAREDCMRQLTSAKSAVLELDAREEWLLYGGDPEEPFWDDAPVPAGGSRAKLRLVVSQS